MEIPDEVLVALRGLLAALERVRPAHVSRLRAIAREIQASLEARLKALAPGRYTTQEVRGKLAQVRAVVEVLGVEYGRRIGSEVEAVGRVASQIGRDGLVEQIRAWGPEFPEAARLLSRPREASDVLDPGLLEYYRVSRETYGIEAINKMKGSLARAALEGKTIVQAWEDMAPAVDLPEWKAERIVRTEQSFASHRRQILDSIDAYGDDAEEIFAKQLEAVFDNRTGEDSKFVHGQVRRLTEPFNDGKRDYQHPPNRPNDREVVVLVPIDEVEGELGPPDGARKGAGAAKEVDRPSTDDRNTRLAASEPASTAPIRKLVWHEPKREKTLKDRGLDFADAGTVLDNKFRMDIRSARDGEERIVSFAVQETGKILALVHLLRGDDIRIISFRVASKSEQRNYLEWLKTRE